MALIGSIIGDIIGSQYEFPSMRPDDLDWQHCVLFTNQCEFTDDTVMSIATKYAFDKYNGDFVKAYQEFGRKYPDKGYGDMFKKWIFSDNPKPYGSYGNGSAMRVSYIGDFIHDIDDVIKISEISATCTHDSNSGIKGATTIAAIIHMLNSRYNKSDIYDFTREIYRGEFWNYSESMTELRKNYVWSELCNTTVPAAIRCFLDSTDYESCIRNCLSLTCDMDTMCCIAGGMAEAFYRTTGLDNKAILKQYLDDFLYKCIEDII